MTKLLHHPVTPRCALCNAEQYCLSCCRTQLLWEGYDHTQTLRLITVSRAFANAGEKEASNPLQKSFLVQTRTAAQKTIRKTFVAAWRVSPKFHPRLVPKLEYQHKGPLLESEGPLCNPMWTSHWQLMVLGNPENILAVYL